MSRMEMRRCVGAQDIFSVVSHVQDAPNVPNYFPWNLL